MISSKGRLTLRDEDIINMYTKRELVQNIVYDIVFRDLYKPDIFTCVYYCPEQLQGYMFAYVYRDCLIRRGINNI